MLQISYINLLLLLLIATVSFTSAATSPGTTLAFPAIVSGSTANVTLIGPNVPTQTDTWNSSFVLICQDIVNPLFEPFSCSKTESKYSNTQDGQRQFVCMIGLNATRYDGCTAVLSISVLATGAHVEASNLLILSPVIILGVSSDQLPVLEETSGTITIPMVSGIPPNCRRASFSIQLEAAFIDPNDPFSPNLQYRPLGICFGRPKTCDGKSRDLVCDMHFDFASAFGPSAVFDRALQVRASITRDRLLSTTVGPRMHNVIARLIPARPLALPSSAIRVATKSPVISIRLRGTNMHLNPSDYRFTIEPSVSSSLPRFEPVWGPIFESPGVLRIDFNMSAFLDVIHGRRLALSIPSVGFLWSDLVTFYRVPLLVGAVSSPPLEGALVDLATPNSLEIPVQSTVSIFGRFLNAYGDRNAAVLQVYGVGPYTWCTPSNFRLFRDPNVSISGNWARFSTEFTSGHYGCSLAASLSVAGTVSENTISLGRLGSTLSPSDSPAARFTISMRCLQCASKFPSYPSEDQFRVVQNWIAGIFLPSTPVYSVKISFYSRKVDSQDLVWVFRIELLDEISVQACHVRLLSSNPARLELSPIILDNVRWEATQSNFACLLAPVINHGTTGDQSAFSAALITILSAGVVVLFASFSFGVLLCRLRERRGLSRANFIDPDDSASTQELEPIPTKSFTGEIDGVSPEEINTQTTEECSICLERKNNARIDPCGHWFCEECVVRIRSCALCRATIEKISILQVDDDDDDSEHSDEKDDDKTDQLSSRSVTVEETRIDFDAADDTATAENGSGDDDGENESLETTGLLAGQ